LTYGERPDVDVGARVVSKHDEVLVIGGQLCVDMYDGVATTFKLQRQTRSRADQPL